jgi:DNA-binding LacI/PurR family transcriptional regulator
MVLGMSMWQRPPAVSLLAAHLRGEVARGRWHGRMPGVIRLAKELGVARNTVEGALKELELEGLLVPQGHGRGRRIEMGKVRHLQGLRVGILPYEEADRGLPYLVDLQHQLEEAGHVVDFSRRTLLGLGRNLKRVAAHVGKNPADAWVVMGCPRDVTEWFAAGPVPAFAMFGRRRGVPIAGGGPDKLAVIRDVVRKLCGLGHQRIVLYGRSERRKPEPGAFERTFLEELAAQGVSIGSYHLPDWEETPEGFLHSIDRLFAMTRPTALIFNETFMLAAAQLHLAERGILSPRDVSLVCCDPPDAALAWMRPRVAHIRWDSGPLVRRVLQWLGNVQRGRKDLRQTEIAAGFVEGETIGPVE